MWGSTGYETNGFAQVGRNLWKKGETYFRLFGHSITPNGCWIAAAEMREVIEFDIATGQTIYGPEIVKLDCVSACVSFETIW